MASSETCQSIRNTSTALTTDSAESVVRSPDWGAVNFVSYQNDLQSVMDMCRPYLDLPIEYLPDGVAQNIVNELDQFFQIYTRMRAFDINQSNNIGVRDDIGNQLRNKSQHLYNVMTPHIPYLAYIKGDVTKNIRESEQSRQRIAEIESLASEEFKKKSDELDEIIKAAREASASVGVAHFTSDFTKSEAENNKTAGRWLKAVVVMAVLTLVFAVISFFYPGIEPGVTLAQELPKLVSKIFVLGLLGSTTIWCARIYKAQKHLAIVNRHRADALKTFQAFVRATDNDTVRDAVLLETTRSIFATGATGYIDSGDSVGIGDLRIVELIKAAGQK